MVSTKNRKDGYRSGKNHLGNSLFEWDLWFDVYGRCANGFLTTILVLLHKQNITLVLEDVQAVKRSVRNLVLLNEYEKPFHPEIHGGVRDMLFENMTPIVANVIARKVEDVINNFEPRARLVSVRAIPNLDNNAYEISISFYVVNAPTELVDLSIMLERIR